MIKFILVIILSLSFYSTSFAEWTKVVEDGSDEIYVDFSRTIIDNNGYYQVWTLTNKDLSKGIKSAVALQQIDCKLFKFKILYMVTYKEKNAIEKVDDFKSPNSDWEYSIPNSNFEKVVRVICN